MNDANPTLAQAFALDRQGRLADAIKGYRQCLAREPQNPSALQLLGIALARTGRLQEAVETLSVAVAIQPGNSALQVNLGTALSTLGRHAEAMACYDRCIELQPHLANGHHGRGMALMHLGQTKSAVEAFSTAVRLQPGNASFHNDFGLALERLGQRSEALSHFARSAQLDPRHVQAHYNLGLVQANLGQLAQALASLDRALGLQPQQAAIHAHRGSVLADLGRSEEALVSYKRALDLQEGDAATQHKRAQLLLRLQRPAEALAGFEATLALAHGDPQAHFGHGVALARLKQDAAALASFDRSLAIAPHSAETHNNRGVVLLQLGRTEEAYTSFKNALGIAPGHIDAQRNVATTLMSLQRHREALECFEHALTLKPEDVHLKWGKGCAHLAMGEFRLGWPLHESRLQLEHLHPLQRHSGLPRWLPGQSIQGKTLLVHAEQGLGDTVQFCRYLPLLEASGAQVIFEVQPALETLLRSLTTGAQIVPFDAPLPAFDLRTPLLSLPWLLGSELQTVPCQVPYLSADGAQLLQWKERLAGLPGLKVGIAWQGNPETERQGGIIGRSSGLAVAAPLAEVPGATLISLQKGSGAEQRDLVPFAAAVLALMDPWAMGHEGLMEVAALISALDLVITTDTLTAHLAGALGIPVWVVLGPAPDWRWLTQREDSPWYPTMRLFRHERGGWPAVYMRVAQELSVLCAEARR